MRLNIFFMTRSAQFDRHTSGRREGDDLDVLLTENRIFKQRNVDIAVVSLDDAWARGFSGVMLRGSGAAWDLRKAQPYECYSELDFGRASRN